jgi:hypothetical protein
MRFGLILFKLAGPPAGSHYIILLLTHTNSTANVDIEKSAIVLAFFEVVNGKNALSESREMVRLVTLRCSQRICYDPPEGFGSRQRT